MNKIQKKKGFTLIELIIVILILGILAAIAFPAMSGYTKDAKKETANTNARTVFSAASAAMADKAVINDATMKTKVEELAGKAYTTGGTIVIVADYTARTVTSVQGTWSGESVTYIP